MKLYQCDFEGCEARAEKMKRIEWMERDFWVFLMLPILGTLFSMIIFFHPTGGRYLCDEHYRKIFGSKP